MTAPNQRRALLDALAQIPSAMRAVLTPPESRDEEREHFLAFCYYGWGVVLNSAQEEACADVLMYPEGTVHVWRFANRTGKTTGLILLHTAIIWRKWRYLNADLDDWFRFKYRTLHAAPLGSLTGKAWETADALIARSDIAQRNPITHVTRPAFLPAFFTADTERGKDNVDRPVVRCANGSQIDFGSTQGGAGRLESQAWWFIDWDEFGRQQPIEDVPLLIDQTFLPRSSDFMAPVVLSSTSTEDADPIYAEIEDQSNRSDQRYWHFLSFGREANFAQSSASMDRQRSMAFDSATVERSVGGQLGAGGNKALLPTYVVRRTIERTPPLPEETSLADLPLLPAGKLWKLVSAYDHAIAGDLNALGHFAVPWPILRREDLLQHPVIGIRASELRSSGTLTPAQQERFLQREYERILPSTLLIDSTAEGGQMVFRAARAKGLPVVDCNFTARRPLQKISNKAYGLNALRKLLSYGLEERAGEIAEPASPEEHFGVIRLPFEGPWRKVYRQLTFLRRDDANDKQDWAMVLVMLAWWLFPHWDRKGPDVPQQFSLLRPRTRPRFNPRYVRA